LLLEEKEEVQKNWAVKMQCNKKQRISPLLLGLAPPNQCAGWMVIPHVPEPTGKQSMPRQSAQKTLVKKVQRVVTVVDKDDALAVESDGETE